LIVNNKSKSKNYAIRQAERRWEGALIPTKVLVEVTHRCNLKCSHCFLEPYINKRQSRELSTSEWAGVLKQLFELGVFSIIFSGGEALCRPDIFEIMTRAKEIGLFFGLKTNGTLITEAVADRFRDLGLSSVDVSLYGAKPETHEYVTGVAGSYAKTIQAIKLLRERKLIVRIKSSIMKCNAAENKEMENIAREMDVLYDPDPTLFPKVGQPSSVDHLRMDDEQLRTYIIERNWILNDAEAKKADPENSLLCAAGRFRCTISPQGEVFPCAMWRIPLGDLRQQTIQEIWNGEAVRKIRSIKVSDMLVCANCELVGYCSRCPGLVYTENGGISGRSSENCRLARLLKEVRDCEESLH